MAVDDNRRSREPSEAKNVGKGIPDGAQDFSLDEIMSEYRYEATLSGRPRRAPEPPVSKETKALKTLAEEMKAYAREQEMGIPLETGSPPVHKKDRRKKLRHPVEEPPDAAEIVTASMDFGPPEDFDKTFAPSDDFVRGAGETTEELPEEPIEEEPAREPLLVRIRKRRRREPSTVSLSPDKAAARLMPYIRFLNLRLLAAGALCLIMVFLTFAHQLEISLPAAFTFLPKPYGSLYVFIAILLALQILVMACGIDVLSRGLGDLCRFRPGFESVALLSCLANVLYAFSLFVNPATQTNPGGVPVYLPYNAASALAVLCAMWSQRQRLRACQLAYQTAAAAAGSADGQPLAAAREETLWPGGVLIKTRGEAENFVDLTEQPDGAARFVRFFAPLEIIAALMLALIASVGQGDSSRFFWTLSAILSVAAPFCGAFCYTLPFWKITKRLSRNGTALAGWTGARAFFEPASIILADRDLFPPGTITLNGLKVFEGFSLDRMISCAASLTAASGSALTYAFEELLHNQQDAIRPVSSFKHFENGGLGGEVGRDNVLLGNSSFMLRMGIRLPQGIKMENVLFVAVNLELVGVFAIHYTASGAVRSGMSMLMRNRFTPLLATRDVNLTPPFVGKKLGLNLNGAEYPQIELRLELSEPERPAWSGASAVLGRNALYPFAEGVVAGRRLGLVTRINLVIYLACALAGLLIMGFLTLRGEASTASPCNVILYLTLWTLPAFLMSGWVHRY